MNGDGMSNAVPIPTKPSRTFIACARCRTRKARCDGKTPRCTLCVAHDVDCSYATVRRTRGPAKRDKHIDSLDEPPKSPSNLPQGSTGIIDPDISHTYVATTVPSSTGGVQTSQQARELPLQQTTLSISSNQDQTQIAFGNHAPIVADFLLPNVYGQNLKTLKGRLGEVAPGRRYTQLLPIQIARRLVANSFAEVMAEHQLLDQSAFVLLLEEQYTANFNEPDGHPTRWALVNAILALATRAKMAPGSEGELSDIPRGFYHNATTVIPDLILQAPSLLSIQSLLAMAMFAQGTSEPDAFVMLASNASRQLELVGLRRLTISQTVSTEEAEHFKRAYIVANALEKAAIHGYNAASVIGQS